MLQSEAGYFDARPLTPARQNLLQRTAGPYIWVIRVVLAVRQALPVYSRTADIWSNIRVASVRANNRHNRTGL
jgi:hypothetical protein